MYLGISVPQGGTNSKLTNISFSATIYVMLSAFEFPNHNPHMPTRRERLGYALADVASVVFDVVNLGMDLAADAITQAQTRRERDGAILVAFSSLTPAEQVARLAVDAPDLDLLDKKPDGLGISQHGNVSSIFSAPADQLHEHPGTLQTQLARAGRGPLAYCPHK